jgi:hypothetical protein
VGFQKIANLPMKRLRELEEDRSQFFADEWYFIEQKYRTITEADKDYQQFLRWLERHSRKNGELLFESGCTHFSALGNMFVFAAATESQFESFTEGGDISFSDKDYPILDELQRHGMLCSELLFRYHRLYFAFYHSHLEVKEEYAVFAELCKKVVNRATEVLSSARPSIGNIGGILESLIWYIQKSVDSFAYHHFES